MALVLHELATNAAKYGALSGNRGNLSVIWHRTEEGGCELVWQESGGPAVKPPRTQGFGSVLINRSVPYDLGGESEISYDTDGVRARFLIPASLFPGARSGTPERTAYASGYRQAKRSTASESCWSRINS